MEVRSRKGREMGVRYGTHMVGHGIKERTGRTFVTWLWRLILMGTDEVLSRLQVKSRQHIGE